VEAVGAAWQLVQPLPAKYDDCARASVPQICTNTSATRKKNGAATLPIIPMIPPIVFVVEVE